MHRYIDQSVWNGIHSQVLPECMMLTGLLSDHHITCHVLFTLSNNASNSFDIRKLSVSTMSLKVSLCLCVFHCELNINILYTDSLSHSVCWYVRISFFVLILPCVLTNRHMHLSCVFIKMSLELNIQVDNNRHISIDSFKLASLYWFEGGQPALGFMTGECTFFSLKVQTFGQMLQKSPIHFNSECECKVLYLCAYLPEQPSAYRAALCSRTVRWDRLKDGPLP